MSKTDYLKAMGIDIWLERNPSLKTHETNVTTLPETQKQALVEPQENISEVSTTTNIELLD
jgi:hypothetical protein